MLHQTRGSVQTVAMPSGAGRVPPQKPDLRADGQLRSVCLSRDVVRIDRRVAGMAMRVAVPVRSYQGVALGLRSGPGGALCYTLNLIHGDRDLSVVLDEAGDDHDIVADWRLWSRFFRLPALVERQAGAVEEADLSLGAVLLGEGCVDRRGARAHSKHRPRFLRRRKMGVMPAAPMVHPRETEMIARR